MLYGASPGSPQLDSFGPSLLLASELAKAGEYKAVVDAAEEALVKQHRIEEGVSESEHHGDGVSGRQIVHRQIDPVVEVTDPAVTVRADVMAGRSVNASRPSGGV